MAQSVKCLPHKHECLSLMPSTYIKKSHPTAACICNSVLRRQKQRVVGLTGKLSYFGELQSDPVKKNKIKRRTEENTLHQLWSLCAHRDTCTHIKGKRKRGEDWLGLEMTQQFKRVHTAFSEDPSSVHNSRQEAHSPEDLMSFSHLYGYLYSHAYPHRDKYI